jgi:hypothetical protein
MYETLSVKWQLPYLTSIGEEEIGSFPPIILELEYLTLSP